MNLKEVIMDRGNGISDNLHGDLVKKHMTENWTLNPTYEGVPPYVNVVGEGDNLGYRVMPGRKKGMMSG
jgi:hypothetical protein